MHLLQKKMAKNLRFLTALKSPYLRPNLPISKHKSPYLGQRRYHMYDYGYLSYFVEIVIFLSDVVARQHRIVPADLCISLSLLFPNKRHI